MIDDDLINSPAHYVKGRTFEPIKVIEDWSLCHHLACVVKYFARAGRKHSALNDLKKAEWYLNRELERYEDKKPCSADFLDEPPYCIEVVLQDWKLSPNLSNALTNILISRMKASLDLSKLMSMYHQYLPLYKAMGHLRLELTEFQKGGVKSQVPPK